MNYTNIKKGDLYVAYSNTRELEEILVLENPKTYSDGLISKVKISTRILVLENTKRSYRIGNNLHNLNLEILKFKKLESLQEFLYECSLNREDKKFFILSKLPAWMSLTFKQKPLKTFD